MGEEEAADPEHRGRVGLEPLVEECDALQQVCEVAAQGLQRPIGLAEPPAKGSEREGGRERRVSPLSVM